MVNHPLLRPYPLDSHESCCPRMTMASQEAGHPTGLAEDIERMIEKGDSHGPNQ